MQLFDAKQLRRTVHNLFPVETLAKGSAYHAQHCVTECSLVRGDGWLISARVRGSKPKPYVVEVEILPVGEELKIHGTCSCPWTVGCKHIAAVLLQVLDWPAERFGPAVVAGTSDPGQLPLGLPLVGGEPVAVAKGMIAPPPVALDYQWNAWLVHMDAEVARRAAEAAAAAATAGGEAKVEEPDCLWFIVRPQNGRLRFELAVAKRLKKGGFGKSRSCSVADALFRDPPPSYLRPDDRDLVRRVLVAQRIFNTYEPLIEGETSAAVFQELVATGRCQLAGPSARRRLLALGPPRPAKPEWKTDAKGWQLPTFTVTPPATEILPLVPPWYYDEEKGLVAPLETGMPDAVALAWLSAPPVAPSQAQLVSAEIARRAPVVALPAPQPIVVEDMLDCPPVPCLLLHSQPVKAWNHGYRWSRDLGEETDVSLARLTFDYAGVQVPAGGYEPRAEGFAEGRWRRASRIFKEERTFEFSLAGRGLLPVGTARPDLDFRGTAGEYTLAKDGDWFSFLQLHVPRLRAKGWRVEIDESFKHRIAEVEEWYGDAVDEKNGGWFGVELGVIVDGEKVNLLPILMRLFQESPETLSAEELANLPANAVIPVPLPDGRKVLFPAARAKQMLGVLLELMNPDALGRDGKLRLSRLRAAEIAGDAEWRWLGAAELGEMSKRLRNFAGITPVAVPAGLQATLRPYQAEGINWLQFLREYGLAGILADDMGLGKTVQALAHLLIEKESGRMNLPSLVVAPTSLMTNWRQEAERFAPSLRVLVLHGGERKQHFERIADHDLIVTSYPLLPRDQEVLLKQEFHCVILDEAQFIKNPKTLYAQVACQLRARHHLCLTGTPMENHLGELWSLFHFLLPGFLGDEIRFNSLFRRPIEKGRNDDRRVVLARRVAPFILRRRKEQVALELPPKTEIVQNVELTGAQRDLYESVRLAMHERVRAEVDRKGISRAHIIILDALLKLRQICCHPQLLSLPSAQKVTESAKLELLMDQLPEMIEEGRKILLFSQFTSMLAIIQLELAKAKIPYVILTGQTQDRATPVEQFQNGEVPLFLISLKAGGTGLNLTAADTVIHYDPWWNPAVENQATDRAHRIGQSKKVFVYKFMTVGTVEEKIAALQLRKKELVEGLLDEEHRENLKLTPDDLEVLFAPLT